MAPYLILASPNSITIFRSSLELIESWAEYTMVVSIAPFFLTFFRVSDLTCTVSFLERMRVSGRIESPLAGSLPGRDLMGVSTWAVAEFPMIKKTKRKVKQKRPHFCPASDLNFRSLAFSEKFTTLHKGIANSSDIATP